MLILTECAGLTMTLGYLLLRSASPIRRLGAPVRGTLLALLAGGYIAGQAMALLLGERLFRQGAEALISTAARWWRFLPATRASSEVNSWAWPLWCAARPPRLAIWR